MQPFSLQRVAARWLSPSSCARWASSATCGPMTARPALCRQIASSAASPPQSWLSANSRASPLSESTPPMSPSSQRTSALAAASWASICRSPVERASSSARSSSGQTPGSPRRARTRPSTHSQVQCVATCQVGTCSRLAAVPAASSQCPCASSDSALAAIRQFAHASRPRSWQ